MKIQTILLIGILFMSIQVAVAHNSQLNSNTKPDFDSLETIFQRIQQFSEVEITFNFDSLRINRRKDTEQMAQLVFKGSGQSELRLTTKIRPRGRFRRIKCEWMPIRLNFDKEELKTQNLYTQYDKLKLVTHCNESEADAQILVKEYWTYKLYNELTDNSFRVHLLKVTYIDEVDATNKIQSYALIIENSEEMAHRLSGELVEGLGITSANVVPNSYHTFILFNYMIGNTDWQLKIQKNLKLVELPDSEKYIIIPYDFDFAKIVDPPYLRVSKSIANLDEYNRAALGKFSDKESLEKVLTIFQSFRKTNLTCYQRCTVLTDKNKKEMASYLKSFFKKAKDQQYMETIFLDGE